METYPGKQPSECRGQRARGYGDGIGEAKTGGEWTFRRCIFRYNTQDGLDLLYLVGANTSLVVENCLFYSNSGNQLKTAGKAVIRNNVIVGDCAFFDGKPYGRLMSGYPEVLPGRGYVEGDFCRGAGGAATITVFEGNEAFFYNNTVLAEGTAVLSVQCNKTGLARGCSDRTRSGVHVFNNILRGYPSKIPARRGTQTVSIYQLESVLRTMGHNLIWRAANPVNLETTANCPLGPGDICADPRLAGDVLSGEINAMVLPDSPAIRSGVALDMVQDDYLGNPRPHGEPYTIGAYEYVSPNTRGPKSHLRPSTSSPSPLEGLTTVSTHRSALRNGTEAK